MRHVKAVLVMASVLLGACTHIKTQPVLIKVKEMASTVGAAPSDKQSTVLRCSGGEDCQITKVMNQQGVESPLGAGRYQVQVSFYPVTRARAEQFVLIHDFDAGHQYELYQYRQHRAEVGSVLSAAVPDPLCVDLRKDQQTIRTFCRPFDSQTGLGEFVEQSVAP